MGISVVGIFVTIVWGWLVGSFVAEYTDGIGPFVLGMFISAAGGFVIMITTKALKIP